MLYLHSIPILFSFENEIGMRMNAQIQKDLFEQPGFVYMQEQRFSNQQIVNHQIQGGLAWTVAKPRRVKQDFPGAQAGCSCQMLMMRLRIKMMVIVMMMRVVVMMMIVVIMRVMMMITREVLIWMAQVILEQLKNGVSRRRVGLLSRGSKHMLCLKSHYVIYNLDIP